MYRIWAIFEEYSLLLIVGALIALTWANIMPATYPHLIEYPLWHDGLIGHLENGRRTLTLHYLVNDVLMAFFFALAGKEVWEAVALRHGALRGKRAVTPLVATAGGMIGPMLVYLLGAYMIGKFTILAQGWAIPTATDIAFSYLIGRLVFGARHPAVKFLLLLAIADDAGGLVILAIFYPQGDLAPLWLLLSLGAAAAAWLIGKILPAILASRKQAAGFVVPKPVGLQFWPYAVAACLSWYGFQQAGIHPALGLLPIIPAIPLAETDIGLFAEEEAQRSDLLNQMQRVLKKPVQMILMLFGLVNAGVEFLVVGDATWIVLASLLIGKPLGISIMGWFAARPLGFGLPHGMRLGDLPVMGCVAAVGFTVALFVAVVALPLGAEQDAAKMGALFSFGAVFLSLAAGKVLQVKRLS